LVLKHLFQLVYQTHLNLILISGSGVEAATGEAFGWLSAGCSGLWQLRWQWFWSWRCIRYIISKQFSCHIDAFVGYNTNVKKWDCGSVRSVK